jgi:hypothetical protein
VAARPMGLLQDRFGLDRRIGESKPSGDQAHGGDSVIQAKGGLRRELPESDEHRTKRRLVSSSQCDPDQSFAQGPGCKRQSDNSIAQSFRLTPPSCDCPPLHFRVVAHHERDDACHDQTGR